MKKKTIIFEENTMPPTNYIWGKPDGKFYAYNNETRTWEETVIDEGVYTKIDDLEDRIAVLEEKELIVKVLDNLLISNDAAVIADLMKAYQQGTIFDVIIEDNSYLKKVSAAGAYSIGILETDGIFEISLDYTLPQYEGLAAIQAAAIARGLIVDRLPALRYGSSTKELGAIIEESTGMASPIIDEDGNVYSVTFIDGNYQLVDVQKTQHAPEYDGWDAPPLMVTFEEVQKLIGLPIREY